MPEHFQGILHNVHMPYFCIPEQAGAYVVPPHDTHFLDDLVPTSSFKLHSAAIISNVKFGKPEDFLKNRYNKKNLKKRRGKNLVQISFRCLLRHYVITGRGCDFVVA